ncbi:MAG: hypothetical protein EOO60_08655 [Hymenobacter sp.]|nr:MAG: hypothetical protein EOO60_08655 [Hymenobacter sp.]
MTIRLLATPLVAATLLLSTLGCSKKEAAAPAVTGSYKLDGVVKTCQVTALSVPASSSTQVPGDQLLLTLITTPQPAGGPEGIVLTFSKPFGQPPAAYQLDGFAYLLGTSGTPYNNEVTTLQEASGSYSGTFSGTPATTGTGTTLARKITDGVFAGVRP